MRRWPQKSLAAGYGIARTIEEDQGGATPPLWYRLKAGAEVFPSGEVAVLVCRLPVIGAV